MSQKKSILFIVKNKNEASSRFRVFSYMKHLKNDFDVHIFYAEYKNTALPKPLRSLIKRIRFFSLLFLAFKNDILFMQRPMSSDKSTSTFFEWLLNRCNPWLIFDFDDALFVQNEPKIRSLISLSKACICGNEYLEEFAQKYNRHTYIIPTPIDTEKFQTKPFNENKTVTIGWTGTSGNYAFFTDALVQAIKEMLASHEHVNFLFICDKQPEKRFDFPYEFIQWSEANEVEDLKKIDIGLMPLIDSPWTKGKCGFKLIQYGTIAIPSVASDVGVNSEIILDQQSGYIVKSDAQAWKKALERLINSPETRREMGKKAREHIDAYYSVTANYPKLKKVLDETMQD